MTLEHIATGRHLCQKVCSLKPGQLEWNRSRWLRVNSGSRHRLLRLGVPEGTNDRNMSRGLSPRCPANFMLRIILTAVTSNTECAVSYASFVVPSIADGCKGRGEDSDDEEKYVDVEDSDEEAKGDEDDVRDMQTACRTRGDLPVRKADHIVFCRYVLLGSAPGIGVVMFVSLCVSSHPSKGGWGQV